MSGRLHVELLDFLQQLLSSLMLMGRNMLLVQSELDQLILHIKLLIQL